MAGLAPLPTYQQSQLQKALQGKTLSILGDSISTFQDVSNNVENNSTIGQNATYYYPGRSVSLEETWWKQLLDRNLMSLCVNNSWSGSWIYNPAAWEQRCVNLHNDHTGQTPDLILVYMGTNDYINHVKNDDLDGTLGNAAQLPDSLIVSQGDGFTYGTPTNVIEAFAVSLHKMKAAYPQAKILVMTPYTYKGLNDEKGARLAAMSAQLEALCQQMELECVNLFSGSAITYNSVATYTHGDGLHPNALGMDAITYAVEKALWKSLCQG